MSLNYTFYISFSFSVLLQGAKVTNVCATLITMPFNCSTYSLNDNIIENKNLNVGVGNRLKIWHNLPKILTCDVFLNYPKNLIPLFIKINGSSLGDDSTVKFQAIVKGKFMDSLGSQLCQMVFCWARQMKECFPKVDLGKMIFC